MSPSSYLNQKTPKFCVERDCGTEKTRYEKTFSSTAMFFVKTSVENTSNVIKQIKQNSCKPDCERRDCRSTSAKPAVRRFPQQRTPQVHRTEIKTVKTFKIFMNYDCNICSLIYI